MIYIVKLVVDANNFKQLGTELKLYPYSTDVVILIRLVFL